MLWHKAIGAGGLKAPFEVVGTSYSSGSTGTINYPTGTTTGDLLLLLFGADSNFRAGDFTSPSGWTSIWGPADGDDLLYAFYRNAGAETSLSYSTDRQDDDGCAMIAIRSASYIQSNGAPDGVQGPPFAFTAFSGATTSNSVVCFVVADDDVTTGANVTQTGFSVEIAQFVGTSAGRGVSLYITFADGIIDSTTYTPPDLNDTDIVSEAGKTLALEIAPT